MKPAKSVIEKLEKERNTNARKGGSAAGPSSSTKRKTKKKGKKEKKGKYGEKTLDLTAAPITYFP